MNLKHHRQAAGHGIKSDRRKARLLIAALAVLSAFASGRLQAQTPPPPSIFAPPPPGTPPTLQPVPLAPPGIVPPPGGFVPRIFAPSPGQQPPPPTATVPAPLSPRPGAAIAPAGTSVRLQATSRLGGPPLNRGLIWRVYADKPGLDGKVPVLTQSSEAQPLFRLPPGTYLVNAAFGRATVTRRLEIGANPVSDTFVLNAGAMRLQATAGERIIPDTRVTYSVSAGPGPGGTILVENVRAGRILRLPVGDYFVNSRYGEANAFMSGDIKVESGRLTEVTMKHRAAQITLKLVSTPGGEALANTAWTVLTPGGDTVQESIGAFPIMVLGAGDYTVIARNDGRIYNARFSVETGRDREVEVVAK